MPDDALKFQGTFLGFDFGTKRLGIAIGQSITNTATPLITLQVQNGIPQWNQLAKIIQEWQPKGLVVGLPLQPDGSHSTTSRAAVKFAKQLEANFQLPIYYIEERLTSVAAEAELKETPFLDRHQQDLDALAAAIILKSWLNSDSKENSQHVPV